MTTFPACSKLTVILSPDHRLHLPEPPVRAVGVAHQHAGFEELLHVSFAVSPMSAPPCQRDRAQRAGQRPALPRPDKPDGRHRQRAGTARSSPAAPAGPEIALVNDSLATALAKLRFYRVAFGPADGQARQSLDEAAQITDAMFHGRFTVAWEAGNRDLPRPLVRLAYLAILCLEKSLPMGGLVRVSLPEGGDRACGRRPAHAAAGASCGRT